MRRDPRVQKILEALADDPPPQMDVRAFAQSVNLSAFRLYHLFKLDMGVSLGQFVRSRRMEQVKRLLADSFLSVKEVMAATGFAEANEASFIREFRQMFGMMPREFRRLAGRAKRSRSVERAVRKAA